MIYNAGSHDARNVTSTPPPRSALEGRLMFVIIDPGVLQVLYQNQIICTRSVYSIKLSSLSSLQVPGRSL